MVSGKKSKSVDFYLPSRDYLVLFQNEFLLLQFRFKPKISSCMSRGLLAAKSRLAKKGLTIPRLELVSAHMAANLAENVKNAPEGQPVRSVHEWLDSTVALHWIREEGSAYKQFVANRVNKI